MADRYEIKIGLKRKYAVNPTKEKIHNRVRNLKPFFYNYLIEREEDGTQVLRFRISCSWRTIDPVCSFIKNLRSVKYIHGFKKLKWTGSRYVDLKC